MQTENKTVEELTDEEYYTDSIIIKVKDEKIDDIATCFDIDKTIQHLMIAPLELINRTSDIPDSNKKKELQEKLWKYVRSFYKSAQEALDGRYKL